MVRVGIVFENGIRVYFEAQEFDISFVNVPSSSVHRFEYKDREGNSQPLYLTPKDVAGVVVSPLDQHGDSTLALLSAS